MLNFHHLRNATLIIETQKEIILVDPMLGDKESMPSFTEERFPAQKNPTVDLPENSIELLQKVTHCLITHQHEDHLDKEGIKFLKENNIPVICSVNDRSVFEKRGLNVIQSIEYWSRSEFLGGIIEGIPAKHGYGKVAELMGNVMGYYLNLENEKSIYLSSDTIYTEDIGKVLKAYKPDISILACGSAQLDKYAPILMTMKDIITFVKHSSGIVIANHLEALNHCPTTRKTLSSCLKEEGLLKNLWIPEDGESLKL